MKEASFFPSENSETPPVERVGALIGKTECFPAQVLLHRSLEGAGVTPMRRRKRVCRTMGMLQQSLEATL